MGGASSERPNSTAKYAVASRRAICPRPESLRPWTGTRDTPIRLAPYPKDSFRSHQPVSCRMELVDATADASGEGRLSCDDAPFYFCRGLPALRRHNHGTRLRGRRDRNAVANARRCAPGFAFRRPTDAGRGRGSAEALRGSRPRPRPRSEFGRGIIHICSVLRQRTSRLLGHCQDPDDR